MPDHYLDRDGFHPDDGYEIDLAQRGNRIHLALGETRRSGAFVEDAWAALTSIEARQLARDLQRMADDADHVARAATTDGGARGSR